MAQTSGGPNTPALASGQRPAAIPSAALTPENTVGGGITVGANYDDNVIPNAQPRQWDVRYSVVPEITLQETRPRVEWSVSYSPGLETSQELRYRNLFSQKFSGRLVWRTSPHGSLSAEEYYLVSMNPFAGFKTNPGPTISPNESVFIPNVRQKMTLSHLLYSYQSSAQVTMGIGGSFELQKFDSTPKSGPTTALVHAQIVSGQAFIARQMTPRNQLGLQYDPRVMKFPKANARTTTHTFLVFDQMDLSRRTHLTLYGGPEYALTSNQVEVNLGFVIITIPVKANTWNGAGGVMYSWTGDHIAATVDFTRGISDGGGLVGAVELTSGTARLSWQFTRSWSLESSISGADDQLVAVKNAANELRIYSGELGLHRRLWRDTGFKVFYQRLNQTGSINNFSIGNRDIIGVALDYTFLKPLGG